MNVKNQKAYEQFSKLAKHLSLISLLIIILFPVFYIISISLNPTGGIGSEIIQRLELESLEVYSWNKLYR